MSIAEAAPNHVSLGQRLHEQLCRLYPLHRSITGAGLRATLGVLGEHIPLTVLEVPSGTRVLDWEIPLEWQIRDAYIATADGRRVVDYRHSNLHVVNYSQPIRAKLRYDELAPHLHSLPEQPNAIPYRTSFFQSTWGFCLSHLQRQALERQPHEVYDVVIDADHTPGALSLGECYLPGRQREEVLIYAHTCHPSLANDNLSGLVVAAYLAERLAQVERRYSYRFVFAPATIGAIAWLATRREQLSRIRHGLVLTLLGDAAPLSYKRSRQGAAMIDRAVEHVLLQLGLADRVEHYSPLGYDERQFGSPGFNLPVGVMMRSRYGTFPEYHTSLDCPEFVRPESLADAARQLERVCRILEENRRFRNLRPEGEPMLGRYGIYRAFGEADDRGRLQEALLWVLNGSDGSDCLLTIANRSKLPFEIVRRAADLAVQHHLLEPLDDDTDAELHV